MRYTSLKQFIQHTDVQMGKDKMTKKPTGAISPTVFTYI